MFIEMNDDEFFAAIGEPTLVQRTEVEEKITESLEIFQRHFKREFTRPTVVYDLRGHTAGYAIGGHTIRLNAELLVSHHDGMINRTVPHEVAHIVQRQLYPRSKSHGAELINLMLILTTIHTRIQSGRTYKCRSCGERLR